jgi:hypothetical protein
MLGMLNERYIVNLPRLKRDKTQLCDTSPQYLHWLWIYWTAKLLNWKDRHFEGQLKGFFSEIYAALRENVFPFPKIECTYDGP